MTRIETLELLKARMDKAENDFVSTPDDPECRIAYFVRMVASIRADEAYFSFLGPDEESEEAERCLRADGAWYGPENITDVIRGMGLEAFDTGIQYRVKERGPGDFVLIRENRDPERDPDPEAMAIIMAALTPADFVGRPADLATRDRDARAECHPDFVLIHCKG